MLRNKPAELTPHYYLNNFRVIVDYVFKHYQSLLSDDEAGFYEAFILLPENCQQLLCRLLLRSNHYVRRAKISYAEINAIDDALIKLVQTGFITPVDSQRFTDWIGVFAQAELPPALQKSCLTGNQWVETDLFGDSPIELLTKHEAIYHVQHKNTYALYSLLFFGNLHQDISEFVLSDLGHRRYESYLTDYTQLPFQSRDQLLAYCQYYLCRDQFDEAAQHGADALLNLHQQLPEQTYNDPVLTRRIENLSNKIARQLERENAIQQAVQIYRSNTRPPARERLARLQAKQNNLQSSLNICTAIKASPAHSEELEFAEQFSTKLQRQMGHKPPKHQPYQPPELSVTFAPGRLPVERITALHFAKTGACHYVENSLIVSVFGLAVWDIIFCNRPGVFYHPFQSAPADFQQPEFRTDRQQLFEQRFAEIRDGELQQRVMTHFYHKRGITNPLVYWRSINFNLLTRALRVIPTQDWLHLFDYILRDIKNHRSGLPDLIYFPDTGGYQLLEVKGPGDKLQHHQRRWMQYFYEVNIDHAVVNVDYQRHHQRRANRQTDALQLSLS